MKTQEDFKKEWVKIRRSPLEQKPTRVKIRQRLALIIAGKLIKREFTKILEGLIGIIIKLPEKDWVGFN